ncbi:MAG: TonB-dependent receptor [Flavobacteriia bacterium]|nr:TonB-dependent receptor [Flavobacteriia bacterium]
MKKLVLVVVYTFVLSVSFGQSKIQLSGTVYDKYTKETLIGVRIVCGNTLITKTNIDGNYVLSVAANTSHNLKVSYFGYDTLIKIIQAGSTALKIDLTLSPIEKLIDEVVVKAEIAKARETPIAFSTLSSKQIAEELGTRDLPMVLNSTPGAYATEQGGGVGDARVSIRGFDQRNIAVLVDGVPVNDMENGQVYWSNWDGIGDITRYMQVQRGLGASKLSIVSVGGTMNIVTKGIDSKMSTSIKQEVNGYGLFKTAFGYNTGLLKGNWGITIAGSKKWGTSYADATFDDAYSYFMKVQKKFDKHLLSFGVNGAPQSHGQRTTRLPIAVIDKGLAERSGINYQQSLDSIALVSSSQFTTTSQGARGIRYNPNYGMLNGEEFNEKINFFHKPQFNLTHSYNPNEKINLTTVTYVSIGKGGGTQMKTTLADRDSTNGLYDIQGVYDLNKINLDYPSDTEHASSNYLSSKNNDHKWFGLLSTFNYKLSNSLSSMFGVDARYYKGAHYQSVYDLMGGDYAIDSDNQNQPVGAGNTSYYMKRVGDKIAYHNDATVKWAGFFGQIEYKKDKWSSFLTSSFNMTGYQRTDYFKKKDLVLSDTTLVQAVGYGDTLVYNGVSYNNNSTQARFATTDQKWFSGATIKAGMNYNINSHENIFCNLGYLSIAPKMNAVFDNNNIEFLQIKNQEVSSFELGYGHKSKRFSSNLNMYYTLWRNKPPQNTPTVVTPDGTFSYNINGLDALHRGIEIDFIYKILPNLDFEGLVSLGDWKTITNSKDSTLVNIVDNNNIIVTSFYFGADNVHVGDAAQVQLGTSLRYEIIKNLYFKLRFTYFDKNYSNFDPLALTGKNINRESWKMPSYGLLDLNFGYDITYEKINFTFTGGMMNIANTIYISDAQNGANFNGATSTVFVGMGRRFSMGLKVGF